MRRMGIFLYLSKVTGTRHLRFRRSERLQAPFLSGKNQESYGVELTALDVFGFESGGTMRELRLSSTVSFYLSLLPLLRSTYSIW